MKLREHRRFGIVAVTVLVVSSLGIGATASSGTHVKASGLAVEVSRSGYGTDCNYWFSVGAYQTDGGDDYVSYHAARWEGTAFVWESGDMLVPGVLSGGPGRVTMAVDTPALTVDVVLTPNGRYSSEMSGRIEERDDFGGYLDAFTGHRTQNSADATGTFTISGWEPPVCDTSNTVGGWIGTERGTHTYR